MSLEHGPKIGSNKQVEDPFVVAYQQLMGKKEKSTSRGKVRVMDASSFFERREKLIIRQMGEANFNGLNRLMKGKFPDRNEGEI